MKTYIYFIRHGKVNNPKNIWYGRLPGFSLEKKGRLQIEKTARFLAGKKIDILYSSKLLRARQSAQIIKDKLKLTEINFSKKILEVQSSLEGKSFSYISSIEYDVFADSDTGINGETLENLASRMQKFISEIIKKHRGKKIAVISHGDPIMIVKALSDGLPVKNSSLRPGKTKYIQHGEVYLLEYNGDKKNKIVSIFNPTGE